MADTIQIVTRTTGARPEAEVERGLGDLFHGPAEVDVATLRNNMSQFLHHIGEILASEETHTNEYQIEEVEVYAQISAEGQVSLLGIGGSGGIEGGLKFVLRRQAR